MTDVTWLDPVVAVVEPEPYGSSHPIRAVTEQIAAGDGWSPARRSHIASVFDELSPGWHEAHITDLRLAPLEDALERGGLEGGTVVELGAGTGAGTERLARWGPIAAAIELSPGMLARVGHRLAPFVRGDAAELPLRSRSVDVLVLVNMFLFAVEVDRILRPDGCLLWVNTLGEETPIHLPPESVVGALPGSWSGVASRAGTGLWCVARRGGDDR